MIATGHRIDRFTYSYGGAHGDPAQTMSQSDPNPAAVPGADENGGPGVTARRRPRTCCGAPG
jgi:hypothetical protein